MLRTVPPSKKTMATMRAAMPATIRPYSTAVAPSSFFRARTLRMYCSMTRSSYGLSRRLPAEPPSSSALWAKHGHAATTSVSLGRSVLLDEGRSKDQPFGRLCRRPILASGADQAEPHRGHQCLGPVSGSELFVELRYVRF